MDMFEDDTIKQVTGWHSGLVGSTVTSHKEMPGIDSQLFKSCLDVSNYTLCPKMVK